MRAVSGMALFGACGCLAAAAAACGDAFSTGAAGDDGGAVEGGTVDAGGGDGSAGGDAGGGDVASEAPRDAPGGGDGSGTKDAGVGDSVAGHDVVAIDAPPPQDGAGDDVVVGTSKVVFVTSQAYSGNLGGLSGADAKCQDLASAANLPGTYKAWLSSTATSASARLTHGVGPYTLMNGVKVADGWTGLTSGSILVPIDVNEKGGPPPSQSNLCGETSAAAVWTSTAPNGTLGTTQGATCQDWTSSAASNGAVLGLADRIDGSWTSGCSSQGPGSLICGISAALYCIQQ